MHLLLLGTGAAEGIPAFYSNTRVSEYARKHGGKDVRTRSGALIDGSLKIDLSPDTLVQMNRERLDVRDWSGLLFTHGDDDHFAVGELQYCLHPFNEMDYVSFAVYGNDKICAGIAERYPGWPIEVVETRSFEPFTHCDFTITPVAAMHNSVEDCQNHIIERGGKSLLYATDTGIWQDRTWAFLKNFALDCLVIECTEGLADAGYVGHLTLDECVTVVDRLRREGILKRDATVVTTHHSHNGAATHGELVVAMEPYGIEVGYDGYSVEI